jgi:hypothetical protein
MAAVWEFFSGAAEIDDSELPAKDDQREPSPEAETVWQAVSNFVTGTEIKDSELPAKEHRADDLTPARKSKRSREPETPVAEDSGIEATLKSDSAAKKLTRDDLKEYLADKGEQVPPNAKKDQLLALARSASTPKPAAAAAAEAASPKDDEEQPKLTWTITRLKKYAEEHDVQYPSTALKLDIFEAIVAVTGAATSPRRSTSTVKRGKSASVSRNSSKKK